MRDMELLIKNTSNAGYEYGDVIDVRDDGFPWSTGALNSVDADGNPHFTVLKNITLTLAEIELLKLEDNQLIIPKSAIYSLKIRHSILKKAELRMVNRRRYTAKNGTMEGK